MNNVERAVYGFCPEASSSVRFVLYDTLELYRATVEATACQHHRMFLTSKDHTFHRAMALSQGFVPV